MNIDETKKAIEVMQAYVDGAEIETQPQNKDVEDWVTLTTVKPSWNWKTEDYRIKPKPREFWLYPHFRNGDSFRLGFKQDDIFTFHNVKPTNPGECIKVREVL